MAAVSSAQAATATTLTPPSSSHGHQSSWGQNDRPAQHGFDFQLPNTSENYENVKSPTHDGFAPDSHMATRRKQSTNDAHWDESTGNNTFSPSHAPESRDGRASEAGWRSQSPHKQVQGDEDKWVHRDKLAKIESQELQAAGLYMPRSRAPSKQRRDRSRSQMRRGTDASEPSRSRKNSVATDHRLQDVTVPSWDLRTPEEIADDAHNAYFSAAGYKGTSRIPVAKTSPAPIPLDCLERGSTGTGRQSESPEGEAPIADTKRSRSASATLRIPEKPTTSSGPKRPNTDVSPKKGPPASRKMSTGAKTANQRPKTRSGSGGAGIGSRPVKSGDSPPSKKPEGDPPWVVNSYQPDPRLPPDQQLLPTVAKRLQQERWEKEGTYGDTYDRDFRPLNDRELLRPPENEKPAQPEEAPAGDQPQNAGEWPLRPESAAAANKSPTIRQGSYSTMPKISDKQTTSPVASPRLGGGSNQQMFQPSIEPQSPAAQRVPEPKEDEKEKKGGCGCCVVM